MKCPDRGVHISWSPHCGVPLYNDFPIAHLLFVLSTLFYYVWISAGVPPTDSRPFFDYLDSVSAPSCPFSQLRYSVLALGDYNYPHYCRAGKTLDTRLSELGCECLSPRVEVDLEDWSVIDKWVESVLDAVRDLSLPSLTDYLDVSTGEEETGVSRTRPFLARMTVCLFSISILLSEQFCFLCLFVLSS